MLEFVRPELFWGFLIIVPYLVFEILYKDRKRLTIPFSRLKEIDKSKSTYSWLRFIPLIIRTLLIIIMITAMARPRLAHKKQTITGQGIDIMLVIDVSGSMMAIDFQPENRLEHAPLHPHGNRGRMGFRARVPPVEVRVLLLPETPARRAHLGAPPPNRRDPSRSRILWM